LSNSSASPSALAGPRTRGQNRQPSNSRVRQPPIRARVFVLFLDVDHVEGITSQTVRTSLVAGLNRIIGPDDLIAVMTPEMSARNLSFSRRTSTLEGIFSHSLGWAG
jgi:hypothetical protein